MVNSTFNETLPVIDKEAFIHWCRVLWLCGITISSIGLFVQLGFFALVPQCRKYDEKILTMLTCTRIVNTICEFIIINDHLPSDVVLKDIIYVVYFQTDFILVCWMFVFSKNLYDKVVLVFTFRKCGIVTITLIIFFASLPFGVLCPVLLKMNRNYFTKYYKVYAFIKFVIIIVNALIFVEILSVAYKRGSNRSRNLSDLVKAAMVSFILVCITSLQVFTTDLLSLFLGENILLIYTFCVINSLQVAIITVIFVMLAKGKKRDAVFRSTITIRFNSRASPEQKV